MDEYRIRELGLDDLAGALTLVLDVFMEFEAPDYVDEGIKEFQRYIEFEAMKGRLLGDEIKMWGCFSGNSLVGVLSSQPGHINLLFVDKNHHRKGIARALFHAMADHFKGVGVKDVTVNSSPYAAEVYRRLGFIDTDSEQTVNGIRFIPMKVAIA